MKNIIITILVMLVLGLGGYLVYDKVIDKENNSNVNNEVTENKQENDAEENTTNIISYVEESNGIPYITLDNFESINQEIKEFYNSATSTYNYEYSVKRNILFIYLNKVTPAGMGGTVEAEGIYIDLDNNKELTISEVIQLLNINNDDLNRGLNGSSLDRAIIMPSLGLCVIEGKGIAEIDKFYISC